MRVAQILSFGFAGWCVLFIVAAQGRGDLGGAVSSIRERATLISVVLLVPAVIGGTIGVLSARYLGGLAIMGPIGVGVVGSVLYIWKGK